MPVPVLEGVFEVVGVCVGVLVDVRVVVGDDDEVPVPVLEGVFEVVGV